MGEGNLGLCGNCQEHGHENTNCWNNYNCYDMQDAWQEGYRDNSLKWRPLPDEPPPDGEYWALGDWAKVIIDVDGQKVDILGDDASEEWTTFRQRYTKIAGPILPPKGDE